MTAQSRKKPAESKPPTDKKRAYRRGAAKRAAGTQNENSGLLDAVLRGVNVAVFRMDKDLRYTWVSQPQWGYSVEEIIGFTDEQLLPPGDGAIITEIKRGVLETGIPARREVQVHAADRIRVYDLTVDPVRNKSGKVIGLAGALLDVTDQKQAEDKARRLNYLYITLSQINQAIVRASDKDSLFKEVCRVVVEHGRHLMAWIGLIEESSGLVIPAFIAGEHKGYLDHVSINYLDESLGRGPTGTAIREGRCVICQDIATDPRMKPWREQALSRGYRSSAAVPIRQNGRVIGALTVYAAAEHSFAAEDEHLLDEIGADISFALDTLQVRMERERAEEAYRTLIEHSIQGFMIMQEGRFVFSNPAASSILGYSADELRALSPQQVIEMIFAEDREEALERMRRRLAGQEARPQYEYRVIRKDGKVRWLYQTAVRIEYQGKPAIQLTALDVTERKHAEEALIAAEARYRTLVEQIPLVVYIAGADHKTLYVSPQIEAFTGYSPDEWMANKNLWVDRLHPEDKLRVLGENARALSGPGKYLAEYRLIAKDGTVRWIHDEGRVLQASPDSPAVFRGIWQDITESKHAEELLRHNEEKYRQLFVNAPVGILLVNLRGEILDVNPEAIKILGSPSAEATKAINILTFPLLIEAGISADFQKAVNTAQPVFVERPYTTKWGKSIDMFMRFTPLFGVNGQIELIQIIIEDITVRKNAEEALRRSNEEYRYLTGAALDGFWRAALDGRLLDVNEAYCQISGYSRDELLDLRVTDLEVDESEEETLRHLSSLKEIGHERFETRHRRKDGRIIDVEVNSLYVPLSNQIMSFLRDITSRKQTEERIRRQLERLTALKNIDQIITSSFDLKASLEMLLNQAVNQLNVDAADILIFNPILNTLEFRAGRGFHTQGLEKVNLRLGVEFAGRAALERRPIHVDNLKIGTGHTSFDRFAALENFVSYYCIPLIAKGRVKGVLETFNRSALHPDREWLDFLETLAQQAAIAVDSIELFENLQRSNHELTLAYDATIEGWSHAMDLRGKEPEGHTQRVAEMSVELARKLGVTDENLVYIRWGALLHDIGKIGIPDEILQKPSGLTEAEWQIVKQHPSLAYEMLSPIRYLRASVDIPYCHHEKWDGTGYPRGLSGEQIPLAARIFSVVDVWDALTSDRPYRKAWPKERARQYILEGAGTLFDPIVVKAFLESDLTERY
jgi:PAS domain S-box-containing protein/putative nucleotidyltransferase with HDIG domain